MENEKISEEEKELETESLLSQDTEISPGNMPPKDTKGFDGWNEVKKQVDFSENKPIFYEREIWHCKIGINVGYEQNGVGLDFVRPVLVFKKFNQRIFWAIPLTKTIKNLPFYFTFTANNTSESSTAILSQIRLTDSKRLLNKVSDISLIDFETLKEKFKTLLP